METTVLDANHFRKFGLTLSVILCGIFGTFLPFLLHKPIPYWPWVIGLVIFIPALIKPLSLKIIYTPWMKLGSVLGWINTRIILGIIFFILITPIGILLRLLGKDLLSTRLDKSIISYRKITPPQPIQHMEKPF